MSFRRYVIFLFFAVAALAVAAVLNGCSGPPKRKASAPPPSVSTMRVERAVRAASDRTERVVDTVRGIQSRTKDADTAAELAVVVGELVRVKADLRDATERSAELAVQSEKLEQWGMAQQQTADANAEGWREEKTKSDRRGRWLGLAFGAGAAGVIVAGGALLKLPIHYVAGAGAVAGASGYIAAQYLT